MKLQRITLEPVLFSAVWKFGPKEPAQETWGRMVFLPFGRTFGYDNPNEYGWDFFEDNLRFLSKSGEPTSVFAKVITKNGRLRLTGQSLLNPGSVYCLDQIDPADD